MEMVTNSDMKWIDPNKISPEFDDSVWVSKSNDNSAWALELADLTAKLEIAESKELPIASSCCIFKVPSKLRKMNEEAYTPSVISIGPYHHGNDRVESMQNLKIWYLNKFLKRDRGKSLENYLKALQNLEDDIRSCYSEIIQMKSNEFLSMILTDTCFIIEFFIACLDPEDPLAKNLWPTADIKLDLILLENQLPFFVLAELFHLTFPDGFHCKHSFAKLAFDVFVKVYLKDIYPELMITFNHDSLHQVQHLCDMLRNFYLPSDRTPRQSHKAMKLSCNVSQLHEAGMKFQVDKKSKVTKLQYSEGKILKIPGIVVNDLTETMLRNVVAFEQCHKPSPGYVTDYVCMLDDLIDTKKDVEILTGKKIMVNLLGDSNEVASMVNKLCKNVAIENINADYISLYKDMDNFCDNPYHKYKAIFVREYWSTPWKIASVIAATLLLLLTFIQTIKK